MNIIKRIYYYFYKHLVFNPEDWHFYVITYNGKDTKMYVDGNEIITDKFSMSAWFKH